MSWLFAELSLARRFTNGLDTHGCFGEEVLSAPCESPKASTTSTGSTSKGVEQYSENMAHIVLSTVLAFVRSVAVHSMNTSFVSSVICMHQIISSKAALAGLTLLITVLYLNGIQKGLPSGKDGRN